MKLNGEYLLTEIDDEVIACPIGAGQRRVVVLNESGRLLWGLLEAGSSEEALSAALCAEFAVTEERASADVRSFLNILTDCGLL